MIGAAVGVLAIAGSIGGAAQWVDGRYETRAHVAQMRADDEQSRIQSDIDLYTLKINFLEQKPNPTKQDMDELDYLQKLVAKLRDRLKHIG